MNSRLLNLSTVLVAVVTVGVGIFVYNSAQSFVPDNLNSITVQEIEAFNGQFTSYEGTQTGSNIKALIGRLIANANTYRDETSKVPGVVVEQLTLDEIIEQTHINPIEAEDDVTEYIQNLNTIRNSIEIKHEYYVEITYQSEGLIDYIHISYDELNPITDLKYR